METDTLEVLTARVEARDPASETDRARFWMEEVNYYLEQDPAFLESACERMEGIAEASGYRAGEAWASVLRGWIKLKRGENEEARSLFSEAVALFEPFSDAWGMARALNGIGVVEIYTSLFDSALETLGRARGYAESVGWKEVEAVIDSNLGLAHLELGDYAEAARRLEASREGALNPMNRAVTDSHLAAAYAGLGRSDESRALLEGALSVCEEGGHKVTYLDVLTRYGGLLLKLGDLEGALARFGLAVDGARALGNGRLLAEAGIERGLVLGLLGRLDESAQALGEASSIAADGQLPSLRAKALEALAELYARKELWKEAYLARHEASSIAAQVFSERVAGQASQARSDREAHEAAAFQAQLRRLALIADIGKTIAGSVDEESTGRILYERIARLIPMDAFGLALVREGHPRLDFLYSMDRGVRIDPFSLPLDAENSLAAHCARTGEDILIADAEREHARYARGLVTAGLKDRGMPKSILYCPVRVKEEIRAIVTCQCVKAGAYDRQHLEILRALCAYAGVALENARLFAEVQALASVDPLTGALNRRCLLEAFTRESERISRYGSALSLAIFDLDHFKSVNDRYGHGTGDEVLKAAARLAAGALRASDSLGRYGGEEFVLLFPSTAIKGATIVAERIRKAFEAERLAGPGGEEIRFTASFGIACLLPNEGFESLVARADAALYKAKEAGRNRVFIADR